MKELNLLIKEIQAFETKQTTGKTKTLMNSFGNNFRNRVEIQSEKPSKLLKLDRPLVKYLQ